MPYTYEYPHPAVTVDVILFAMHEGALKVLLIQRKSDPHAGKWAIPGGFVEIDEDLATAARRELNEETGLTVGLVEQLHTFGTPKRDPRERVITVAYYALVRLDEHAVRPASDARDARWFPVNRLPKLAFDHDKILDMAVCRLQNKAMHAPVVFDLLPETFELADVRRAFEAVLGGKVNERNLRRQLMEGALVRPVARKRNQFRFEARQEAKRVRSGGEFKVRLKQPRKRGKA